ncbi:hypothetical protein [Ktedonobacter robiniae]|uniref:Uncharacterized protein n=1 Tax=Ktedonobacter robiniae TaxID=2778365 RepID=A0ABQ3UX82_9CHLR|nr:hypothetical protein [Ktedonobacter robiniae]GHO57469.1 hypothetical protein KSB_59440 [Ktedonobacter robiniae]
MTTYAAWDQEMAEDIDSATIFATVYDKVIERWNQRGIVPGELIRKKGGISRRCECLVPHSQWEDVAR